MQSIVIDLRLKVGGHKSLDGRGQERAPLAEGEGQSLGRPQNAL
jgi:hypothetical protein